MNYKKALELAIYHHKGQTRKRKNEVKEYITHPQFVAERFSDEKLKIIAILHDTVEDTALTLENIRGYGFSEDIVVAIDAITRRKSEGYIDYLLRVKKNKLALSVKVEDIKHNMIDLPRCCVREKYLMALYILSL